MREVVAGQLWVEEYPVRFSGARLLTRMTLLALADGGLLVHSPIPIDAALGADIAAIGEVRAIVAPSTFHHLFVADAQRAFPGVPTYAVEGLAKKRPDLALQPLPDALWAEQLDRVTVGNRVMRELVFFHRASQSVVAVDLVEHFRDETPGTDRILRAWIKLFGMWNKPRPAPELRLLTWHREAARQALEHILTWEFDRMVIAHGELFESGAKEALREAWKFVLC